MQSIWDILTTRLNTRVMLLDYGSDVPALIDQPGNRETFARFYSAIAQALVKWEPGFRVTQFQLVDANQDGTFTVAIRPLLSARTPRRLLGLREHDRALPDGGRSERHPSPSLKLVTLGQCVFGEGSIADHRPARANYSPGHRPPHEVNRDRATIVSPR